MKGYTIYCQDRMGYEGNKTYALKYSKAIQEFNNLLRNSINEYDVVEKEEFSQEVIEFKEENMRINTDIELICRKCPFVLYRRKGELRARIFFWERTSYEYEEYDILTEEVILEEIELLE